METGSPERSPPLRFSVSEEPAAPFDLEAYLERVGYEGPREPTLEALRGLHLAHVTTIPFENLDIQLGRPIRLDLESLQAKLVRARRGGYCFEQNHLFMAALHALGFDVTPLAARVRFGTTEPTPRTHMLLRVDVDGAPWIADVGFGGDSLLEPIPLTADEEAVQFGWTYRLIREVAGVWMLQSLQREVWLDLYAFLDEPTPFVDYVLGNHFTSTHPESHFVRTLTVQMCATDVRVVLRNLTLWATTPDGATVSTVVPDQDALLAVLSERFGLAFPAGTRFRALGAERGTSPAVLGVEPGDALGEQA
jgi:N-hydroxyarylamine O-acetyltransferase